jgi:hypothetical protein
VNSREDGVRGEDQSLGEMVDGAVRRLATAIAIAGALIGLGIYARPGPPHFEAFTTPTGFIRIDTRSGTVIGCEPGRCMTLLRHGQALADNPNRRPKAVPPPATRTPAPKALPAPASVAPAQPEQAPAPANQ